MSFLFASIRLTFATVLVCVVAYTAAVWGFARTVAPERAEGSLVRVNGKVVGSRLIAQAFGAPRYFWPRPSAVGYNAAAAGGSNKSPTNPELAARARAVIEHFGATPQKPLPPELAAASGSGLDPHLTERAALYQVGRVARARGLSEGEVERLVHAQAFATNETFAPERLVNVLELNLALDALRSGGALR